MAGVVNDGGLHVRGGRNNQTVYYVDGVNTSNAFGGESMTSVIHGAIEEVQMQTGGYGAAFGGKMSGVAMAQTKTGRKNYHFTLEGISDDFWAIKNDAGSYQILGIDKLYSYGYNDYTLTASGPIFPSMDKIRFFVALEHSYVASSATRFAGFNQDSIKVTSVSNPLATTSGVPQQKDTTWYYVDAPPGRLPGGGNTSSTINSNLVFDFQPIRFQLGFNGNITRSTPQSSYPTSLVTVNEAGTSRNHPYNYMAYIKLTHTIDPTMFYTLQASYSKRGNNYGPVDMPWDLNAENYAKFGDPSYASGLIDTGKGYGSFYLPFESTWSIPHYYMNDSLAGGVPSTYGTIGMWEETKTMFKLDLSKQIGSAHEIRFGGEYTQGLYRTFSINARSYLWTKRTVDLEPESYTSFDFWSSLSNFIGYDAQGNPVDDDQTVYTKKGLEDSVAINIHNAPAKPKNLSLYLEDQIELKDLIINAGVRYEYMNYGHYSLTNLDSLTKVTGGVIDEKYFGDPRVYEYLLPRLGFSFPITDQAVFTAHYGKYIQRPSINDTYTNEAYLAGFLYQLYGGHYFNPLPSPNLKPERTTEYQFGFKMLFGTNAALKLVAFYRNQQDLITYRHVIPLTVDYTTQTMYQNGDFATIKGVSATFDLRRTERVSARINYTYQVAKGSGSDAGTHASIAWQEMDPHFPRLIYPLNYDQRHKGTAVVDIRTLDNDGPEIFGTHPLGNIGLNLLFAFHSGSPFTRIPMGDAFSSLYGFNAPPPVEAPNSSRMPWFYQLDMKLEKAFNIGSLRMIAFLRGINILDLKSYKRVPTDGTSGHGRLAQHQRRQEQD